MADPLIVNCYFLFDPFQFFFGDSVRGCVRKDGSAKHPSAFVATDGSFANAFRTRNDVLELPFKPNHAISLAQVTSYDPISRAMTTCLDSVRNGRAYRKPQIENRCEHDSHKRSRTSTDRFSRQNSLDGSRCRFYQCKRTCQRGTVFQSLVGGAHRTTGCREDVTVCLHSVTLFHNGRSSRLRNHV